MSGRIAPSILIVDDQPEVTAALCRAFRNEPFEVFTANSPVEGLRLLSNASIDAVISNEQMPVMTGSQFLSVVRQRYPEIIRIILSGREEMSSVLAGINDAQAHRFLLKPSSPIEIATCVAEAMHERERKRSHARSQPGVKRGRISDHFDAALASIWVALQPIVHATDSTVFAYEALVRSDHLPFNTPDGLFDVAQRCRRVDELEHAIRLSVSQRMETLPTDVHIMINLDPRSLSDPELYTSSSVLFPYRKRIILEITECANVHDVAGAKEELADLRKLGYRVAVDDLGAGYSGFNAFALTHPDIVKFDMDLIRNIHKSPANSELVRTITHLCRDNGILTVAEGIETKEECDAVIDIGCDLLQGYHIAIPLRWPKIG